MSTTNTGGPAFPTERPAMREYGKGRTLRDYFAAKAMQATVQAWISTSQYPITDEIVAENAYGIADAMLKARES